jgi:23S rRNA pseudouridine1911/1915/1917 synthase
MTMNERPDDDEPMAVVVPGDMAGGRLDKVLTTLLDGLSRTRVQGLIDDGHVTGPHGICRDPSLKVMTGWAFTVDVPAVLDADPEPEDIPLDIVYEDGDLLVVHPAVGHLTGTVVHALLYHCGDTLSGIGGVKRPGIVHRLDLGTSGLMVVAKHDAAHQGLAAQLADRSLGRIYQAVTFKVPMPPVGVVDQPIGRHKTNRLKMAVNGAAARTAQTRYQVVDRFGLVAAQVACTLATGRTHQIRVHMAHLGYPLWGDPLYGAQDTAVRAVLKGLDPDLITPLMNFPRQALHAHEIHFVHPRTGEKCRFVKDAPDDMAGLIKNLQDLGQDEQ